ncbi:MAG: PAS domain-containing protein [Planctomycetes bacterium]|nr:PAS domain-containing protein [Planctomycetota bacterium]
MTDRGFLGMPAGCCEALLNAAPQPIVGLDAEGRICFCNDVAARLGGVAVDALLGQPLPDREPFAHLGPLWREVRGGGQVTGRPFSLQLGERQVDIECTAVAVPSTQVVLFFGRDVTAERRVRASDAAMRERLQLALGAARMGIWEWDIASDKVVWSPEAEALFGVAPGTFPPDFPSFCELVHPDDRQLLATRAQRALAQVGERYEVSHRVCRRDGSQFWAHCTGLVMRNDQGQPVRMIGTIADVTSVKDLEDQLRHAQKMESIGRLAGGIAHDFNNLLTVVTGEAELLGRQVEPAGAVAGSLRNLREAATRGRNLTRQLLTFARRQDLEVSLVDPASLVQRAEPLLRRLAGVDAELVVRLGSPLGMIRVDGSQIEQVLMNLVLNAREAMPRGGRITLTVDTVDAPDPQVRFAVTDTGIGIPAAARERLFEPFFTTKATGTGLGLSMVYGIVTQCGGRIVVDSAPGAGATFVVLLPQVAAAPVTASVPETVATGAPKARANAPRLLVVDDDDLARDVANRILQRAGYDVQVAGSADEACRLAADTPFEMLVTDVVMPAVDGFTLAELMCQRQPRLKVLFLSGYSQRPVLAAGARGPFLGKPYSPEALTTRVAEVLAGKAV